MREEILEALQSSLDPLAAKAAIDALHPVLESVSPPPLLRRRRRPRVLEPVQGEGAGRASADERTTARFRLDSGASLRGQSEPAPLTVRKKQIAGKMCPAAESPLPPLSLPALRQKSAESGYDTESVIGVLRLVRRRGGQTMVAPSQTQSPARPPVLYKPARIAELRQRFERNRSAITDTLVDDEEEEAEMGDAGETARTGSADLALVAKYFSRSQDEAGPRPLATDLALDVSAPITSTAGAETAPSPMTPGLEGLLRWSSALDVQDLL